MKIIKGKDLTNDDFIFKLKQHIDFGDETTIIIKGGLSAEDDVKAYDKSK